MGGSIEFDDVLRMSCTGNPDSLLVAKTTMMVMMMVLVVMMVVVMVMMIVVVMSGESATVAYSRQESGLCSITGRFADRSVCRVTWRIALIRSSLRVSPYFLFLLSRARLCFCPPARLPSLCLSPLPPFPFPLPPSISLSPLSPLALFFFPFACGVFSCDASPVRSRKVIRRVSLRRLEDSTAEIEHHIRILYAANIWFG